MVSAIATNRSLQERAHTARAHTNQFEQTSKFLIHVQTVTQTSPSTSIAIKSSSLRSARHHNISSTSTTSLKHHHQHLSSKPYSLRSAWHHNIISTSTSLKHHPQHLSIKPSPLRSAGHQSISSSSTSKYLASFHGDIRSPS